MSTVNNKKLIQTNNEPTTDKTNLRYQQKTIEDKCLKTVGDGRVNLHQLIIRVRP